MMTTAAALQPLSIVPAPRGQRMTYQESFQRAPETGIDYVSISPFAKFSTRRDRLESLHLETVRDSLRSWEDTYRPERMDNRPMIWDIEKNPNQYSVGFDEDGRLLAGPLDPMTRQVHRGIDALYFSKTGLSQLGYEVLPGQGLNFLRKLAKIRLGVKPPQMSEGTMMSIGAWNLLMRDPENMDLRKPLKFRTMYIPGYGRTCYAVVSPSYTPFDDGKIIEELLGNRITRDMHVLQFTRTLDGMFLRLALEQPNLDAPMTTMMEIRNSGSARSSLAIRGGTIRWVCLNGAFHWDDRTEHRWNHVGDIRRMRDGLRSGIDNIRVAASGVVEMYERALSVQVTDLYEFIMQTFADGPKELRLTETELKHTALALYDPTTHQNGSLAALLDAGTLAAQKCEDEFRQHDMEVIVSKGLHRGMQEAQRNGGRIVVERKKDRKPLN